MSTPISMGEQQTKIVEYQDDGLDVKLTIGRANVRMGTYRSLLSEKAREGIDQPEDGVEEDLEKNAENILRSFFYPSFIAGVIKQEGFDHWPLTPEEYMELPELLCIQWENAVFTLNPHWALRLMSDEEAERAPKEVRKELEKKAT